VTEYVEVGKLREVFKLEDYCAPARPIWNQNREALGVGWEIAKRFCDLHLDGLEALSKSRGRNPSVQDQSLLLLGAHGFNVFAAALRLVTQGEFDVAAYLLRTILDAQAQFYAVMRKEDFGERFMNDELKASTARRFLVEDLRTNGHDELATFINDRWGADADAANSLSHSCSVHSDKLVAVDGDSLTPFLCGLADGEEARMMVLAAMEYEHWFLGWIKSLLKDVLPPEWHECYDETQQMFGGWAKEVAGPPSGN
jgi:hypothetical protein